MPSKIYSAASDGEDNIIPEDKDPILSKEKNTRAHQDLPPGVTLEDHLAFVAYWGPDYAQYMEKHKFTEDAVVYIPEEKTELSPIKILERGANWPDFVCTHLTAEEVALTKSGRYWEDRPQWLCKVGYWIRSLPAPEEWADIEEPTPLPVFYEPYQVVLLDKGGYYSYLGPDDLEIKIRKKGRTQNDPEQLDLSMSTLDITSH